MVFKTVIRAHYASKYMVAKEGYLNTAAGYRNDFRYPADVGANATVT